MILYHINATHDPQIHMTWFLYLMRPIGIVYLAVFIYMEPLISFKG